MTQSNFLRHLYRSALREECAELFEFAISQIIQDGKRVPAHEIGWKIGHSFSWHYVKIVEYRVGQFVNSLEKIAMAGKRTNSKAKFDASAYVFVKCELSAEDKIEAKAWVDKNTQNMGLLLHDVIASDYKFTCSFSSEHDTFTACLVGKEDNPINGKKTLTARHKDWIFAAMTVLFKHLEMFKGGVWESDMDNEDDGWA